MPELLPFDIAFVGVAVTMERWRIRSYNAARRELEGVCGAVIASGPR